jgi:hypothetical protein
MSSDHRFIRSKVKTFRSGIHVYLSGFCQLSLVLVSIATRSLPSLRSRACAVFADIMGMLHVSR